MPHAVTQTFVACALLASAEAALAVDVTRGQAPSDLYVEGFEGFAQASYNNVVALPGAQMAAIFASDNPARPDQTHVSPGPGNNTSWESFLPIPPTPGDPLRLFAQQPTADGDQNIAILNWADVSPNTPPPGASNSVYGLLDGTAFAGVPTPVTSGGSALALLFALDQSIVGVDLYGVDSVGGGTVAGTLYAYFFARDGSLVGSVAEQLIPRTLTSFGDDGQSFTFTSSGAKFAGVVFTNDDNFGLNFDNLRYQTPVPATAMLLLIGLAGLRRTRRRANRSLRNERGSGSLAMMPTAAVSHRRTPCRAAWCP